LTTSDTSTARATYPTVAAAAVSQPSVHLSNFTPNAKANYVITFTTSATGGGMSGAGRSAITITFPASATGTIGFTSVTDVNSGQQVGSCSASSTTVEVYAINSGKSIAAGAPVKIELDGVTNTTAVSTTNLLTVSTTSDTSTARATYPTVAAAAVRTAWHQSSSMIAMISPPSRSLRIKIRLGPRGGRDASRLPPAALMERMRKPATGCVESAQPVTQDCQPVSGLIAKSSGVDQMTRPSLWSRSACSVISTARPRSRILFTSSLDK